MDKSQQMRASDVRGVERLVGECRELWYDSVAWRMRMFEGLCELTGAQCGMGGERSGMRIGRNRTLQTVTWRVPPQGLRLLQHFLSTRSPTFDTPFWRFQQTLTKRVVTADEQQFVTPSEWRMSEMYNEYYRPMRYEHRMMSCHDLPYAGSVPGDSLHHGIVLFRLRGEEPFGERELQIVHLFHEQCGPLIASALSSVAGDPLVELTPRVGETLTLLLEGDGEKHAAARMGVSPHTVHDYVRQLHRHFGVSHRRELLVRCRALSARLHAAADDADRVTLQKIVETLPPRVQETLTLLLGGASVPDIAQQMRISPHTVGDYVKRLYEQFGVCSRAELFVRCHVLRRA